MEGEKEKREMELGGSVGRKGRKEGNKQNRGEVK